MQKDYNKETPVYAGFFIRLAAFLIDMLLVTVVLCVIKIGVWCLELSMGDSFLFEPVLFEYNIFDILYYVLTSAYFVVSTYCCGATIGKYLMRLKVVSVDGEKISFLTILLRETVGRYLSSIIYIGYIIAGLDSRKQGLHDKISDTCVVYKMMYQKTQETPVMPMMQNGAPVQGRPAMQNGAPVQGRPVMQNGAPAQGRPVMQNGAPVQGRPVMQNEEPVSGNSEEQNDTADLTKTEIPSFFAEEATQENKNMTVQVASQEAEKTSTQEMDKETE